MLGINTINTLAKNADKRKQANIILQKDKRIYMTMLLQFVTIKVTRF